MPDPTPTLAAAAMELPPGATDPRFATFFAYWQQKAPAGCLPGRQHLDPVDMPRSLLPFIALYDVVPSGSDLRFRCRLAGTGVVNLLGTDNTGRFVDETMSPESYQPLHQSYCAVVRTGRPQYWQRAIPYPNREFAALQRLALPLAADGATVDMVMSYYIPVSRADPLALGETLE